MTNYVTLGTAVAPGPRTFHCLGREIATAITYDDNSKQEHVPMIQQIQKITLATIVQARTTLARCNQRTASIVRDGLMFSPIRQSRC